MRKRLKIVLMASTIAATSLSLLPQLCAAEDGDGSAQISTTQAATQITATDDHGRTIYVNDFVPQKPVRHAEEPAPRRNLMYWSSKDAGGSRCLLPTRQP